MKWSRTTASWQRAFAAALFACSLIVGFACNVPVFRYALERWPAEHYELVLFHRGVLTAPEQQQVAVLTNSIQQLSANVVLKLVDVAVPAQTADPLWTTQTNASLPWVVLRAPETDEKQTMLWAGPLQSLEAGDVVDSPARRELAARLLRGDSVVWLLLESGDVAQDAVVASLLTNELKRLESVIRLPPPAPDDPAPRSTLPLRISFSIQRVVAGEARESLFRRMLLHGESLDQAKPIVVPVFGRGRALTALSGLELSPKVFSQAAAFLCGACSCEVKELNPGRDLLLAANWESIFTAPVEITPKAPAITAGEKVSIAPGNPPPPQRPVEVRNERRGMKLLASTTLAFVCIIVLIMGIAVLHSLRRH